MSKKEHYILGYTFDPKELLIRGFVFVKDSTAAHTSYFRTIEIFASKEEALKIGRQHLEELKNQVIKANFFV